MKNLLKFSTLLSVVLLQSAAAQSSDLRTRLLRCSGIDSSFQRVQCYDDLAKEIRGSEPVAKYTPTPVPTPPPSTSIRIQSRNPVDYQGKKYRPELVFSCETGAIGVEVDSKISLGAGDILLNVRYDTDEVIRNLRWRIRPDKRTIYSLRQEELAHDLAKRDNFEVKLMPSPTDSIPFSFDLAAKKEGISAVVSNCDKKR